MSAVRGDDPYEAFVPAQVDEALQAMKYDKLAQDIGRELTDEDVLIWLRSREALPAVGNCIIYRDGDKLCIYDGDDGHLWLSRLAAADLCRDIMRLLIEKT